MSGGNSELDPRPYYMQLAELLRSEIVGGVRYQSGDRLPQAKEIARRYGVNINTVLRSLHLLRNEGLLEFRRGRAITVAKPRRDVDPDLESRVREHISRALQGGITRDRLIHLVDDVAHYDHRPAIQSSHFGCGNVPGET